MTIQIPTSDVAGADPATGAVFDCDMLSRLAGEFFSALPGAAPGALSAAAPVARPTPSAATPQGWNGGGTPLIAPYAAARNEAPAGQRTGGIAPAVPQAHAAALPSLNSPPQGAPAAGNPYYFLGQASAYPSAAPGSQDSAFGRNDFVTAQSQGLPGAAQLQALLRADQPVHARQEPAPAWRAQAPGAFYFIDTASSALPHGNQSGIPTLAGLAQPSFDVQAIRRDFPILQERVNGRQLVWFDNAATTHKPRAVIDRLAYFYAHENSNIHRAAHELAARATDAYEAARNKVARFIGAGSSEEIIFVRGATEAINLVAKTWGAKNIVAGDEIIVSHLEHHANIVPWQQLAAVTGAKIRVIPVDDSGQVLLGEYQRLLNGRTKLVAVAQVSNALGTVVPVKQIIDLAHRAGARTLIDGAQSISHMRVDVQALDADFFVFSGHKVFAPTGIGVVYCKREVLEDMPPWQGGGNMIADVTFEHTQYQPAPARFEAGTGNIADAVGLGAALDYVERIGIDNIARYEHDLLAYATHGLKSIPGVRLIGTAADKASVLSFVLEGYQSEEVGRALNEEGIAVRSGHHCAQPILRRFGVETTVRPSLAFYNTCEEVDRLLTVVARLAAARRTV